MNGIKIDTMVDEAVARAIPALRPLLGKQVEHRRRGARALRSLDTNVVVRLIIEDDAEPCERAGRAFREAVDEGGVFLSATVLIADVELVPARAVRPTP